MLPPEEHELSIEIDGTNFRFWSEIELALQIDTQSAVSFSAPFEPENTAFRELFRPFSYKSCRVLLAGTPLFSGYLLDVVPSMSDDKRVVAVTAYSRAAVLHDCCVPPDIPREFAGLKLLQIASKLCQPFGLVPKLGLGLSEGAKFDKVKADPTQKIADFLSDLAYQRGLVLGADESGDPIFRQSLSGSGSPVASLSEGAQPLAAITGTFAPTSYYSAVTLLGKHRTGRKGGVFTERNTFLPGVVRPIVFETDDTDVGDLALATKARLGRMFGSAISWEAEMATWFTPEDMLWLPDQRVIVEAPGAYILRPTELLVRGVRLRKNAEGARTATLSLMLPGALSGELPSNLPWLD